MRIRVGAALIAAVLALGIAAVLLRDDPEQRFCTAEGWIQPNGEIYGRSAEHDCQFVDGDGNVVTTTAPDAASPTAQDQELIESFLAFAADPGPERAELVGFADVVQLGLGSTLRAELDRADRADARQWSIEMEPEEYFRAGGGPFSALEIASRATGDVAVSLGPHAHCASPPVPPPPEVAALRRVSAQEGGDSCLSWWTVDLFVTPEGEVAAVTLDLYEP